MKTKPLVSVVIPTCNRPQLVIRAVKSALSQTLKEIEVMTIIDGEDEATTLSLKKLSEELSDERLTVLHLSSNAGAPTARNYGVKHAQADWVAFLDDDDEWLPEKLEKQLKLARSLENPCSIITCRYITRTPTSSYLTPRRLPYAGEHISEYLFARNSLLRGEGSIATSMLFVPRNLMLKYPFKTDLRRHQEADWLLKVLAKSYAKLNFLDEPLGILNVSYRLERVSTTGDWRYSLEWIKKNYSLITPRAYSGFVTSAVAALAAKEGDWRAIQVIGREAFSLGQPTFVQLVIFFMLWAFPAKVRYRLRDLLLGKWFRAKQV
ncbi:glycosyltransferase family 2 protein [Almyronema epifaneia]|uniref:Glycosyltransferase family 2 protein n=1 Tax=Almyronema epifaneia S1 TaxID=2991925 RepID=A0ABW6IJY9_9CYAN